MRFITWQVRVLVGISFEQPVETIESIVLGTLNLLEAVRATDKPAKLYNACSSECFGDMGGEIATESVPVSSAESLCGCKSCGLLGIGELSRGVWAVRFSSGILFQPRVTVTPRAVCDKKIVASAVRIASGRKEKLHLGNLAIRRDWGWAPEYVEAIWLMLQQAESDDFIVSTGEAHSLEEFVTMTFDHFGLNWRDHVVIDKALFRPAEISVMRGDPTKARQKLGWEARTKIKQVIGLMLQAEQESPYKPGRI